VRLRGISQAAGAALRDAFLCRLTQAGHADLHSDRALPALRLHQVLREIVYAGSHRGQIPAAGLADSPHRQDCDQPASGGQRHQRRPGHAVRMQAAGE